MKKTFFRLHLLCVLGACVLFGCERPRSIYVPADNSIAPENRSQDKPMAMVNGQAVREGKLVSTLIASYGRKVLDELVIGEIVRQHGSKMGVIATDEMVQAELKQVIENMAPGKSARQQNALFEYMLKKRNMSRAVFEIIMKKQLILRKLVDTHVTINDKTLDEEYQRQFGKKVVIRQIVVSSFRTINQVKARLEGGEPFIHLVQTVSEDELSLGQDGMLPPFSEADSNVAQSVRKAAFELKQASAVSEPVRYYDDKNQEWWVIIRLEKEFPADTTKSLSETTNQLTEIIKQRTISERMIVLQNKLKKAARVKIVDTRVN